MENLAPERTDTSSGSLGSPMRLPIFFSSRARALATSPVRPVGPAALHVVAAGGGADGEARGAPAARAPTSSRPGWRPCRRGGPSSPSGACGGRGRSRRRTASGQGLLRWIRRWASLQRGRAGSRGTSRRQPSSLPGGRSRAETARRAGPVGAQASSSRPLGARPPARRWAPAPARWCPGPARSPRRPPASRSRRSRTTGVPTSSWRR